MESEATIKLLFFEKSTLWRICIPWIPTIPNITTMAPPKTGSGIIVANAPALGNSPKINSKTAA